MKLKSYLLLAVCMAITGCQFPPLHEIDYSGQLPVGVPANLATAKEFAADLALAAKETNLKIYYEDLKDQKFNPIGNVDLRTKENPPISGKGNVSVHIATYNAPKHEMFVMIYGDIDQPEANVIAAKAEEIFKKKYPGYQLVRFNRYPGPLGP